MQSMKSKHTPSHMRCTWCCLPSCSASHQAHVSLQRKNRYLLAVQALKRASVLEQSHPDVHVQLTQFFNKRECRVADA